jgi:hypothetical protein
MVGNVMDVFVHADTVPEDMKTLAVELLVAEQSSMNVLARSSTQYWFRQTSNHLFELQMVQEHSTLCPEELMERLKQEQRLSGLKLLSARSVG